MRDIFMLTSFITGTIGSLVGAILMYLTFPFLLVLTILKIVGALSINWFGYPAMLSVIGTPFWMVVFGFMILVVSMILMAIVADEF